MPSVPETAPEALTIRSTRVVCKGANENRGGPRDDTAVGQRYRELAVHVSVNDRPETNPHR